MYDGFTGPVTSNGKLSDTLPIKTGVCQGCLLSPLLFLITIDWTMKMSVDGQRTGRQWKPFEQLGDLDFSDDLALIAGTHTHIQCKTTRLHEDSKQIGLRINVGKTKVMRLNTKTHHHIVIEDSYLSFAISRPQTDLLTGGGPSFAISRLI